MGGIRGFFVTMIEPDIYDEQGRINKIMIKVDSLEEAQTIAEWFKTRTSMKYVNVCTKRPTYKQDGFVIQDKTLSDVLPIEQMRTELEEENDELKA